VSHAPTVLLLTALTLLACTHNNPIAGLDTVEETPSAVSTPVLRTTLPASWDENWYSSPAVFDIDNDGTRDHHLTQGRVGLRPRWGADLGRALSDCGQSRLADGAGELSANRGVWGVREVRNAECGV